MGKLIAIDGVDSSGKGLQSRLLYEAILKKYPDTLKVSFPDYDSESSALVKMYLSGQFGKSVDSVNAYAASMFFAVDRYASFKKNWQEQYNNGSIIVCDRYVSSNAIHQSVKLPKEQRDEFLSWIDDAEYNKLGLPKPSAVIFLDMPVEKAMELMLGRYEGNESKKDIHEADIDYLRACHNAAEYACEKFGWHRVECVKNGILRTPEDIHAEVMKIAEGII